jgi:hypothetical protein
MGQVHTRPGPQPAACQLDPGQRWWGAPSRRPRALLRASQVDANTAVAIYAEGKETAMAVALTKMSTADIRAINKGIGLDNVHHLNDGLWKTPNM